MEDIARQLYDQKLKDGQIPYDLYKTTADRLMDAVYAGMGGKSFDYDSPNNELKAYLEHNIHAFSCAKSLAEMKHIRSLMTDGSGQVRSFTQFRNAVTDAGFLFNKTYLETEYNTALASADMAAQWEQLSQEPYLEFSTVGDDRVRPAHAALDGYTAPATDPIWQKIYPPLGWNCRCTVIPGVKSKHDPEQNKGELVKQAQIPKYFQNNSGLTKEVFKDDHPYFQNVKGKLTELGAEEVYGLPTVNSMYTNNDFPGYTPLLSKEDANDWWKENAGSLKEGFDVKDFSENSIRFNNEFRRHVLEDNKDGRWSFLDQLEQIIKYPDEVWSQKENGVLKKFYLKYYDDYPYVVRVDGTEAYTMHNFESKGKLNEQSLNKARRGVLLYKKN